MLVTVDIGNTNITIGIFDKEDLIGTYRLTTKVRRTSAEKDSLRLHDITAYKQQLREFLQSSILGHLQRAANIFCGRIRDVLLR